MDGHMDAHGRLAGWASVPLQQLEQLPVQRVPVPILERRVDAPGVEQAEGPAEVPQGVADARLGQNAQHVFEPRQKHVVRRARVGAVCTEQTRPRCHPVSSRADKLALVA